MWRRSAARCGGGLLLVLICDDALLELLLL
jgi:hypothetical protein